MNILEEAWKITSFDRNNQYGECEDNFQKIADYWNVYMDHKVDKTIYPKDVAYLMALMKQARIDYKYSTDSSIDLVGYIRCASRIEGDEKC